MPDIKFTEEEIKNLKYKYYDYGGESYIVRSGKNTVYKIFKNTLNEQMTARINENKLRKIVELYNIENLRYATKPVSTMSVNGALVGYEMTYDPNDESFLDTTISLDEKIDYLKMVREALLYFESLGIVYGDIKCDNILLNQGTKKVKFCDMDNIQIGSYNMDLADDDYSVFVDVDGVISKNVHPYMCNLFTLGEFGFTPDMIFDSVHSGDIYNYFSSDAEPVLKKMLAFDERPVDYLIDYIKK